jgi:chemotaxis signal transduction protein
MAFDHSSAADGPAEDPSLEGQASVPSTAAVQHKFVSFYFGETHYAIPARAVAEVTAHLSPTPLPDSPRTFLGIAPHRGDILAVVEAGTGAQAADMSKRKAIVLRPIGDRIEVPVAFNVDRIGEMLQLSASEIRTVLSSDSLADFECSVNGEPLLIIEPARIANLVSLDQK